MRCSLIINCLQETIDREALEGFQGAFSVCAPSKISEGLFLESVTKCLSFATSNSKCPHDSSYDFLLALLKALPRACQSLSATNTNSNNNDNDNSDIVIIN